MNFISEDFHLHYIASYTLYVQSDFTNDYLVVVNGANEVLVFLHYDNFQPSAEVNKILSLPFAQVIVGMAPQNLIWVPASVFVESEKALYAAYFLDEEVEYILAKEIKGLDVIALYQYDQLLLNRWKKIFPEAHVVANFEILLQQAEAHISKIGDTIGVHIYDNRADIFLFMHGEFKLYNTFEVATADDLSYFVSSIMKNFALIGKVDKIVLSGADEDSEWAMRLQHYATSFAVLAPKTSWSSTNKSVEKALTALNILADTASCV